MATKFHIFHKWNIVDVYHFHIRYLRGFDRHQVDEKPWTDAVMQCPLCGKKKRRRVDVGGHHTLDHIKRYSL